MWTYQTIIYEVKKMKSTIFKDSQKIFNLLQKIDSGYIPSDKEKTLLNETEYLSLWLEDDIDNLPKSFELLFNLEKINLFTLKNVNVESLSTLPNLKSLDLSSSEISDISSLSTLTNLEALNLSGTNISDLNSLIHLSNLRFLRLSNTKISDISDISFLVNLKNLDISDTAITNIDPLSALTNLESLDLSDVRLQNLNPISNLINLKSLNLSDTDVTSIECLSNLSNLEKLNINNTKISNISYLSTLYNLKKLDLSGTEILNIDPLKTLTNLRYISLDLTPITNFDTLADLKNLRELYLANTQITDSNSLSNLTDLRTLNLNNSKITNIDCLLNLKNLSRLNLNKTLITNIESISTLHNLKELFLGGTPIKNIEPLSKLTKLEGLALWNTQVNSVDCLSNLSNLRILSLEDTNIQNIDALSNLSNLEWLYLSGTKITSLPWWLGKLPKLERLIINRMHLNAIPKEFLELNIPFILSDTYSRNGIFMNNTTLATQPISLFEQPIELIRAYYESEQIPINEAKVIFLGDGGAGKTHTIKRIHNNSENIDYTTQTTPGIDITNYSASLGSRKFNIHFWDFGGQEIMHAMHRCFLTDRTCYVVVVSNRWDLNNRARYWLKNIDSFAKGAPVILAINRWDNIQECGIDMNRLTKDYPNLVKQPIYYSAKDSTIEEFQILVNTIIREAGKLDSTAMSFPITWANIRQELVDMSHNRFYIDKKEYHKICKKHKLEAPQIRTWLLEWFNDLGVCFSYHQDGTEKSEFVSYKVLNPSWLTNAIYIIINAGKMYANKGQLHIHSIQDLLGHSEFGVLANVIYSENERNYILDVMRKFNLSYAVSDSTEFIPALCDSETPQELHPINYIKHISYQMKYSYLPDSVVHQLMIRSYQNLNPQKIWRKGLRIDIDWLNLIAVVDMGNDDSTLRIDVYSNGSVEPWKLLHNIRKDITAINNNLGLCAEDYIIIHTDSGDIPKTVNELLSAKEYGITPYRFYNNFSNTWESCSVDDILGMTFGEEVISETLKKAQDENQSLPEALYQINIDKININNNYVDQNALKLVQTLIENNLETNNKLFDCLYESLCLINSSDAKKLAEELKQDQENKSNWLKRLEDSIKTVSTLISGGKVIYSGAQFVSKALQTAYPKILEILPELQDKLSLLPPLS